MGAGCWLQIRLPIPSPRFAYPNAMARSQRWRMPQTHVQARRTSAFNRRRRMSRKKGVMLMNRIGPSNATLWIADAATGEERPLLAKSSFDYHASLSPDGQWVTFTSERNGDG